MDCPTYLAVDGRQGKQMIHPHTPTADANLSQSFRNASIVFEPGPRNLVALVDHRPEQSDIGRVEPVFHNSRLIQLPLCGL